MARIVGIKDVARHAGVSVGTVSNAINRPGLVAPETRERVLASIGRLGYVRSEAARHLRAGQSRLLAMLVLDMTNPFFVQVASGAERAAREAGLRVLLSDSANDPEQEADYLSLFAEQRVRGVLVTPAGAESGLDVLRRQGIPFVLVDRVGPAHEVCSVAVDDVAGGHLAAGHLAESGHTMIGYVSGPMRLAQCRDRRAGALAELTAHGLPEDALSHIECGRMDVRAGREAGRRLLNLSRRPTAVFCANDLLALGVLQALYANGVSVPGDMAIVGYDDIEFAAAAAVPLSSVRQPSVQMGRIAVRLLLEEAGADAAEQEASADAAGQQQGAGHQHGAVMLTPELIVRESSASPAAGR